MKRQKVMEKFFAFMNPIAGEKEGQDLVEYGLILGLVSVVAVIAVTASGTALNNYWAYIEGVINALPLP